MDSLPQEIIEAIIDKLPRSSLRSSSLVARQLRTRSQQRALHSITFSSEDKVNRWHSDIQRGRNRILSYVHSIEFRHIDSWNEPELFGRVLKGFCSLTTLKAFGCAIPDELVDQISRGEFGRGITTLSLRFPGCDLSTITSMILSLPDLKKLRVTLDQTTSGQSALSSIVPQRRSLDLLELYLQANGVAEALIQAQFTFRYVCLGSSISSIHQLLAISSETLVELTLEDVLTGRPTQVPIDLPSFSALTSLRIPFTTQPSRRIINILSSISSTPALASIDIQYGNSNVGEPTPSDTWNDLDRWLARVIKQTMVERGLVLNLRRWALDESSWEAILPRFREAGGEFKIHADGWIDYD